MSVLTVVVSICVLILAGLAFIIYNNLIRLKNNVSRAWSNINVLLEKRYDLISNLINVVKGYSEYEKTLLIKLTQLRSSWDDVKEDDDVKGKTGTSNVITAALKTIFARVESYPRLEADKTFLELRSAITEVEHEIADSRQFYNDSVKVYNTNITVVPYNSFAGILHYKPIAYFEASEDEKEKVNVQLG